MLAARTAAAVGIALLVSITGMHAQEFSVKDGVITFDKPGFKKEFDKMQRDLRAKGTARAHRANTFCISCYDGSKLTCKAIVGGRIGQALCGLGGASSCPSPGTNGVSSGSCPPAEGITR
jgi:hypothetical protein